MVEKHMCWTVSFALILFGSAALQQVGPGPGCSLTRSQPPGSCSPTVASQVSAADSKAATGVDSHSDKSFTQEPQLKEVTADDPVPDAVHQQQLQAQNLQQTGLADDLAGADTDTEGNARIRAPLNGSRSKSISALSVLLMTTAMSSASGIGALPFFFVGALSKEWAALANAVACGVMLAASFDLLHEGQPYGAGMVIFGLILGAPSLRIRTMSLSQLCLVRSLTMLHTR